MKIFSKGTLIVYVVVLLFNLLLGYWGGRLTNGTGMAFAIGSILVSGVLTLILVLLFKSFRYFFPKKEIQERSFDNENNNDVHRAINKVFVLSAMVFSIISVFFGFSTLGVVSTNQYGVDMLFLNLRFLWGLVFMIYVIYCVYALIMTLRKKQRVIQAILAGLFIVQSTVYSVAFFFFVLTNNPYVLGSIVLSGNFIPIITFGLALYLFFVSKKDQVQMVSNLIP